MGKDFSLEEELFWAVLSVTQQAEVQPGGKVTRFPRQNAWGSHSAAAPDCTANPVGQWSSSRNWVSAAHRTDLD